MANQFVGTLSENEAVTNKAIINIIEVGSVTNSTHDKNYGYT